MRNSVDLQGDVKLAKITKKIRDSYLTSKLNELLQLYLNDTENDDLYFLDTVISLEPRLKQQICQGNISEREMDYFFEFYGSITNDRNL